MKRSYDIAVVGGGWAGVCAAAAAARRKKKVLLLERDSSLGGLCTNGFISGILGHNWNNRTSELLVRGEFEQLIRRLHALGGCAEPEACGHLIMCNIDLLKTVMEDYLHELGVTLRFRSISADVQKEGNRITGLRILSQGAYESVSAEYYIDCTGNGELLMQAGAEYEYGRPGDGLVQSLGMVVLFTGIKPEWEKDAEQIRLALEEEHRSGRIAIYHGNVVAPKSAWGYRGYSKTMILVGGIRCAADPRDPESLSRAETAMRHAARQIMEVCRKVSSAFADASIIYPTQIGIRECRRMTGKTVIGEKDIVQGTVFPDTVARGLYWIDIHCPLGYTDDAFLCNAQCRSVHPCRQKEEFPDLLPCHLEPPAGKCISIPLGALCSRNISNLLAAGRCISTTSAALAAVRVISICAATGEAAGGAASMTLSCGGLEHISPAELQEDLRRYGANL